MGDPLKTLRLLAAGLLPLTASLAVAAPLSLAGQLEAGQAQRHLLPVRAGELVSGRLHGAGVRLFLVDAQGQRLRRLSSGQQDGDEFMFVAVGNGVQGLLLEADVAAGYRLELDSVAATPVLPAAAEALPESPRLRAVAGGGAGAIERFWADLARQGSPLVEALGSSADDYLVTFLWRGAGRNVRLLGAPSGEHDELSRLAGTDIWFRSYRLPAATRLAYKLAPDVPLPAGDPALRRRAIVATLQRDPFNPRSFPAQPVDAHDGESILELPLAPPQAWVERRPGVAAGALAQHRLESRRLGNTRTVHLYRSPGYRPGAPDNALLVLFDGEMHASTLSTVNILDNLVAAGKLPPLAAIFVGNASRRSRAAELPPNPAFAGFLADELMPWAKTAGIYAEASRTVVSGASYGGLAAAYAGLMHPEWFGKVYSQSGSFWWSPAGDPEPEWLSRRFAEAAPAALEFLIEAGRFEGAGKGVGILEGSRHLRDVLRARGYPVRYREHASGHDWYHWRGTLGEGLIELLGRP